MHLIPQSWPHLHILISVFPSFGLLCIIGFYVAALRTADVAARQTCLVLLALLALLSVPIYLSGAASVAELSGNSRYAAAAISSHYGWSVAALAVLAATGIAAVVALTLSRRKRRAADSAALVVLGLAVVTFIGVAVADGWEINHRELQATTVIPDVTTPAAWPHVHMILNHAPTAGFVFALAFYVAALAINNDLLKQGSLLLFVICAVLGVPTYVTGTAAMWALTQPANPEISKAAINAHRDMALWTLVGLAFTGGTAWLALWRRRHAGGFSGVGASLLLVLVFALVTLGLMAETGHRGGLINHPEIRTATDVLATDADAAITPAIEAFMSGNTWFVPWQIVHFLGYCLIFGAAVALLLRVFGMWKSVSFAAVHRLLVLGFVGVLLNVFSGMLLMLHDSYRYVVNDYTFAPKITLITIGAIAALYFSASDRLWKLRPGDDAPATAKWIAALVFVAWTGVIVCGRLLYAL